MSFILYKVEFERIHTNIHNNIINKLLLTKTTYLNRRCNKLSLLITTAVNLHCALTNTLTWAINSFNPTVTVARLSQPEPQAKFLKFNVQNNICWD